MGGKPSSSTSQQSIQETIQGSNEGVNTGKQIQGRVINLTEEFPESVQNAFSELASLTGSAIDAAVQAGDRALTTSEDALAQVSTRFEQGEQPELSIVRDLIPVLMIASVGIIVYTVFKRK